MAAQNRNEVDWPDDLGETRPLSGESGDAWRQSRLVWDVLPDALADHPRYELLGFLGAGGMGLVYKARHRLMHRLVALKLIHQSLLNKPEVVQRFRREVRAAARLTHPTIVHAYDAEEWHGLHLLIMEFVPGEDLDRLLAREGRFSVEDACCYMRQVAAGLHYAHEHGMVHRDIKPHNLMLTPAGQVKILDFGLSRFADQAAVAGATQGVETYVACAGVPPPSAWHGWQPWSSSLTDAETEMGTADYMAPELMSDPRRADIRSDIYSLGCTLYRLLTDELPCPRPSLPEIIDCQQHELPRPVRAVRSDVPAELDRILRRMLAKDPEDRYQTPAEIVEALAPYSGDRDHHFWAWMQCAPPASLR